MSATPPPPGTPRYRLERRIATGGMGEVWAATDVLLEREVAVKILKREYADDPTFRARFQTEARHAAALNHPNVASVLDFGELPPDDGTTTPRPFLVMELVPGEPLSALVRRGEPMPPSTAAELVGQAADAVAGAHALGIVHRDIKPANLLVTPDGVLKITDFGIARAADGATLTATGQIVGTPQYLSPEQAVGKPATKSSDIYALGVVLYEALAGHRPFDGDTPIAIALKHLHEDPPPLPDTVPAPLRQVVSSALAKDAGERFGSATAMAVALRRAAGASPGWLPPEPDRAEAQAPGDRPDPGLPPVPTGPVPGAGAAGAVAAVAAGHDTEEPHTRTFDGPVTGAPSGRRRLPGWAPWAVAAVCVLVVVGAVAGLARSDSSRGGAGPSAAPSPHRTTAASRPASVLVRKADYLGLPVADAAQRLQDRGLQVSEHMVTNSGAYVAGTVGDVSPVGTLHHGQTVSLAVWGPRPDSQPASHPASQGAQPPATDANQHGPGHPHGKAKGKKKKP